MRLSAYFAFMEWNVNHKLNKFMLLCGSLAAFAFISSQLNAQELTLEGQTGGFITPTAYVVPSANNHSLSMPAIGFHTIQSSSVIGSVYTISVTEGFGNRFEFGYTRSIHTEGNNANFSGLWDQKIFQVSPAADNGMNIIHGKVVLLQEGKIHPAFAVGGVYRWGDGFVSGSAQGLVDYALSGFTSIPSAITYSNGDIYGAVTKTWAKPPIPFLINFGVKGTDAVIFGLGGVTENFEARFFGGIGIPLPIGKKLVAVPSGGFTSESSDVKNLNNPLVPLLYPGTRLHIPTTVDYAIRITQRKDPHFSIDIGGGHVGNGIGSVSATNPLPPPALAPVPLNIDANSVFGAGIAWRK